MNVRSTWLGPLAEPPDTLFGKEGSLACGVKRAAATVGLAWARNNERRSALRQSQFARRLARTEGQVTGAERAPRAFTLVEVVMSLAIITLVFGGILAGYIQSSRQAEWAGYSLAAQAIGIQQIEQARSAVWDFSISKNELTNMNLLSWSYNTSTRTGSGYTSAILDLPVAGTNVIVATNYVTIKMLNVTGLSNVQVQMVTVDTVWPFLSLHGRKYFTNRTASYFGPDNRDASSL